jgi:methionyl-tRNA formyltransferase
MTPQRILFLAKANHDGARAAAVCIESNFAEADVHFGTWGDPLPAAAAAWQGDCIISYLAPWIVPEALLARAAMYRINFHPGPPDYPGIGCTNFALYDGVPTFGVTCHHMAPAVDTGGIIAVRRFAVDDDETVHSLTVKSHAQIAALFDEVAGLLARGAALPDAGEQWTRRPYRRHELDALCRVTLDMSEAEVRRRVRATAYPGAPGAYLEFSGLRFAYDGDPRMPVALRP